MPRSPVLLRNSAPRHMPACLQAIPPLIFSLISPFEFVKLDDNRLTSASAPSKVFTSGLKDARRGRVGLSRCNKRSVRLDPISISWTMSKRKFRLSSWDRICLTKHMSMSRSSPGHRNRITEHTLRYGANFSLCSRIKFVPTWTPYPCGTYAGVYVFTCHQSHSLTIGIHSRVVEFTWA